MYTPSLLLTVALTLLPSLTVAADVYSSLKHPFVLRTQDHFNVILRYHEDVKQYVPVISHAKIRLPEFNLTDGHLSTTDKGLEAFLAPVPLIFPPVLNPLRFGKVHPGHEAEFVARSKADESGKKALTLWALRGPLVVRHLSEGQPIYVKPESNIDRTEPVKLEIVPVKSSSSCADFKNIDDDQEHLCIPDL